MIEYECKICGCEFAVNRQYIKQLKEKGRYLTCPMDGRHGKIIKVDDFKKIMEERSAVNI